MRKATNSTTLSSLVSLPHFFTAASITNNPDNTAYVIGQIPLMTLQTKAKM